MDADNRSRARSDDSDSRTTRSDELAPHPLANELTDDPSVHPGESPPDMHGRTDYAKPRTDPDAGPLQRTEPLRQAEKSVGKMMATLVVGVVFAAMVIAALLTRQWTFLGIGLLLFVPFIILLMSPFWLAQGTKIAQDETMRKQQPRP